MRIEFRGAGGPGEKGKQSHECPCWSESVIKGPAPGFRLAAGAAIRADEADAQPRFGQQFAAAPDLLVHAARGGAQFFGAGCDDQAVIKACGAQIADGELGNGIGAAAGIHDAALLDAQQAQHLGARALAPAQIIGVVGDA